MPTRKDNSAHLITLYARHEPTNDPVALLYGLGHEKDVVIYEDAECTRRKARFAWHQSCRPRRGQRRVTINCYRWVLEWVLMTGSQEIRRAHEFAPS